MYVKIVYLSQVNNNKFEPMGIQEILQIDHYIIDHKDRCITIKLTDIKNAQLMSKTKYFNDRFANIYIMNDEGKTIDTYGFLNKNEHEKDTDKVASSKATSKDTNEFKFVQKGIECVVVKPSYFSIPVENKINVLEAVKIWANAELAACNISIAKCETHELRR